MTFGIWRCRVCGYKERTLIYFPLPRCPKCGAEYETVKVLMGVHIHHPIPVQRLKGTNKLNAVMPICISLGKNREAIEEFNKIMRDILEDIEKERGAKELTDEKLRECSEIFEMLANFGEKYGYKIRFTSVKKVPNELKEIIRKIAQKHPETVEISDDT